MTDKLHSRIGASSAKRWFNCPGSPREIAKYPAPPTSEYAAEGTEAHRCAEVRLHGAFWSDVECKEQEMKDYVDVYVDTVLADRDMLGGTLLIEEGFELHHLHKDLWGTNDCALITDAGVIIVYDFKYGRGVVVEVEDNEQLMIYALGAIKKIGRDFDTVEIVIVQPRAYHEDGKVRRQVFYKSQLVEFAKLLKKKAEATDDPKAKLKVGEWCRFCTAQPGCPALRKEVEKTAMVAFDETPPTVPAPADITPKDLSRILAAIPMLDEWINSVKSFALEKAKRGEKINGFKLVRGREGNRKWLDEEAVADKMEELKIPCYETVLLSPAKIEKLLPKKEAKGIIAGLTVRPEGQLNLVSEEDSRPEINSTNSASEAFDVVK